MFNAIRLSTSRHMRRVMEALTRRGLLDEKGERITEESTATSVKKYARQRAARLKREKQARRIQRAAA
jgi:hypothetical protein